MSTFANSFWSTDYAGGLGVLFSKLQQGVQENQQILTITRMRADAEEAYASRLGDISPATDRISGGFSRDEGASVRKAFDGMRSEMEEASKNHRKIASNVRELVVSPFSRWCDAHSARVQSSQDDLQARIKLHDRQADVVKKYRSQYYNKCRVVEDLEEENQLAFQEPAPEPQLSPKAKGKQPEVPTIKEPDPEEEEEPVELGEQLYTPEQVKKILTHMLENIKLTETKVPILGTYENVSSGSDIVEYIQRHMNADSVAYAENVGQDLVNNKFLRLVGNVGNNFANSSRMYYQWKPKVFQITGIPERKKNLDRVQSLSADGIDSPVGAVGEYLAGWNPLNNPYPNETPADRLRREAREADERYKAAVRKLDALRCNLEEAMIDHLKFMERCELDRLKAVKTVILDFSGAIGNVIPSLQATVDRMMLFQETVQPNGDLRYFLENNRTGNFVPRVQIYENYYNSVDDQTFGVDLEARARSDRKRVPQIITTLLTYLDNHYPDLEGDEARQKIWLVDVPLAATHHLRATINNGKAIPTDLLEKYEIPIVASVLKLYLLELPDSLVSSHVYEIIKTIYSTTATDGSEDARVSVIQNTLGQLRLANIATLDAVVTHFTRLIELTSADETYISQLSTSLAPCILRPRQETTLTMDERYAYRLLRDLFAHKDAIFGELKRASSQHARDTTAAAAHAKDGSSGQQTRGRRISTDGRSRKEAEQERQQAIAANRSRASSPNSGSRSIRRERSPNRMSGGPEGRFPVAVAAGIASPTERRSTLSRQSLEVPGSLESSPVVEAGGRMNGAGEAEAEIGVDKRDSLNRGRAVGRKMVRGSGLGGAQPAVGQEENRPVGVELVDKPMDD